MTTQEAGRKGGKAKFANMTKKQISEYQSRVSRIYWDRVSVSKRKKVL